MRNVKVVSSGQGISTVVSSLAKRAVDGILRHSFIENVDNRVVKLGMLDSLRVIASLESQEPSEKVAKSILARTCYQAEQQGSLGSFLSLLKLSSDLEPTGFSPLHASHIEELLLSCDLADIAAPLLDSLEMGGASAMLGIKESERPTHIVISDSIDLPVSGYPEFGNDITLPNCRILSYDGVIERVSEINVILEDCVKSECSLVIYARGYGYEVVSTLLHNWRLGKLRVIPVSCVASDLQNFWFADLPSLFGRGDSHMPKLCDLEDAGHVSIRDGVVSIRSQRISEQAATLRNNLREDALQAGIDKSLIDERIRRLSSRRSDIVLGPELGNARGIAKDRLGSVVRYFVAARQDGNLSIPIGGRQLWFPVRSYIAATATKNSILTELNTRTMVIHDT